jgi:uncharacterized membrane protein
MVPLVGGQREAAEHETPVMTEDQPRPSRARLLRTTRFEAFSDGVFAIAITLLVLELGVPAVGESGLLAALANEWPSYLAYVVSFATVGALWLAHTSISEYLGSADLILIRLNLVLLLVVSFLPFPTKLLAEFVEETGDERVAVTIYGAAFLTALLLVIALWRYAMRAGLVRADVDDADARMLSRRTYPAAITYAVLIIVGLFAPLVAVFGYLAVALFLILPFGAVTAHRGRRPDARTV